MYDDDGSWFLWFIFTIVIIVFVAAMGMGIQFRSDEDQLMNTIGGDLLIVTIDGGLSENVSDSIIITERNQENRGQSKIMFSWQSKDGYYYVYETQACNIQRTKNSSEDGVMTVNFNLNFLVSLISDDQSPSGYDYLVENYSEDVTISMTDKQYSEFLKLIYSDPMD